MKINRLKFFGKVYVIQTTTSHISHFFEGSIILINCHQPGNAAFHRTFIDNIRISDSILWKGYVCVFCHDGNRTILCFFFIHPLSRIETSDFSFVGFHRFRLIFCFGSFCRYILCG